jgi:OOP family OmpA-OmpF porin
MKKLFTAVFIVSSFLTFSQEKYQEESKYDRWSVEFNTGQNKAIRPFTTGYYSSDPTVYFNINGVEHYDLGLRYMLSPVFGFKLDVAYDVIKNNDNASSPFENNQYRIGLQGVANLGRLMQFESFTNRFGLLAHAGIQVSQHIPQLGINKDVSEDNGGIMFGLTPQFRLTNYLALTGDFTVINNIRQHLNWDGSYAAKDYNLTGLMYNTSLGITMQTGLLKKQR